MKLSKKQKDDALVGMVAVPMIIGAAAFGVIGALIGTVVGIGIAYQASKSIKEEKVNQK